MSDQTPDKNRQWILASRPVGMPTMENFRLKESPVPMPAEGEALIRTTYLSVDPYMRGRMRNVPSYVPPLRLEEVIEGGIIGEVMESRMPGVSKGDFVTGRLGWQDYAVARVDTFRKIPAGQTAVSAWLGVLGMPGMTAYFGLLEIGKPREGETVVVSSAAGAVGSLVGQIAKIKGCRAVGITGSDEKVRYLLDECKFNAAINYKTTQNLRRDLKQVCPEGVDIYFDNVGGEISDAVMTLIKVKARIVICGQISIYNREKTETGPHNLLYLLVNRARMEGFLVRDWTERFPEGISQMTEWLEQGKIKFRETIVEGLENAPTAFMGLFKGENIGKQLVKVAG